MEFPGDISVSIAGSNGYIRYLHGSCSKNVPTQCFARVNRKSMLHTFRNIDSYDSYVHSPLEHMKSMSKTLSWSGGGEVYIIDYVTMRPYAFEICLPTTNNSTVFMNISVETEDELHDWILYLSLCGLTVIVNDREFIPKRLLRQSRVPVPSPVCSLCGYLEKQGSFNKSFQQRYFRLIRTSSSTPQLEYYVNNTTKESKGCVPLANSVIDEGNPKSTEFYINTHKRRWVLRARDRYVKSLWVNVLKELTRWEESFATHKTPYILHHSMIQKLSSSEDWVERGAVLTHDNTLDLFVSDEFADAYKLDPSSQRDALKARIPLFGTYVYKLNIHGSYENCLELIHERNRHIISATTADDLQKWITILIHAGCVYMCSWWRHGLAEQLLVGNIQNLESDELQMMAQKDYGVYTIAEKPLPRVIRRMQGYMEKRGGWTNRAFKQRFFRLVYHKIKGPMLSYYIDYQHVGISSSPRGMILLKDAKLFDDVDVRLAENEYDELQFSIETKDRTYVLRALNVRTKQYWLEVLREIIDTSELPEPLELQWIPTPTPPSTMPPSYQPVPPPPTSPTPAYYNYHQQPQPSYYAAPSVINNTHIVNNNTYYQAPPNRAFTWHHQSGAPPPSQPSHHYNQSFEYPMYQQQPRQQQHAPPAAPPVYTPAPPVSPSAPRLSEASKKREEEEEKRFELGPQIGSDVAEIVSAVAKDRQRFRRAQT